MGPQRDETGEGASGLRDPNDSSTVKICRMEPYHRCGHVYQYDDGANWKEILNVVNDPCETCPNAVRYVEIFHGWPCANQI